MVLNEKKKILLVSSPPVNGNAGNLAKVLYDALKLNNRYDVWILTKKSMGVENMNVVALEDTLFDRFMVLRSSVWLFSKAVRILKKAIRLQKTAEEYCFFDYDVTTQRLRSETIVEKIGFNPDIVIVAFNNKFLTIKNIYEICHQSSSVVFYLMDMDPLTGGCHYSWGCERYKDQCGSCPAIIYSWSNDSSKRNLLYRKHFIDKLNVSFICASGVLHAQASLSAVSRDKKKNLIFNTADEKHFKPVIKEFAKQELGLDTNKYIILYVASSLLDPRKGFESVISAFRLVKDRCLSEDLEKWILIIVAGNIPASISLDINVRLFSNILFSDMPKFYNAADVFLNASFQDSGPWSINQSILCGTPVISTREGVALDLVIDAETGFLFDKGDSECLASLLVMYYNLSPQEKMQMRKNCIRLSTDKLSLKTYREKWWSVLESITDADQNS